MRAVSLERTGERTVGDDGSSTAMSSEGPCCATLRAALIGMLFFSALALGCESEEPADETPATEAAEQVDAEEDTGPVREELALVIEAQPRAQYTLAINKTTGVRMEQVHEAEPTTVVFPKGGAGVAQFAFPDGRAIEMAVAKPHRVEGDAPEMDGCVLRVNWNLDGLGYDKTTCSEFLDGPFPIVVPVSKTRDQQVDLIVHGVELTSAPRNGDDVTTAEELTPQNFNSSHWHGDAGEWMFQPSSLSAESVVRKKR